MKRPRLVFILVLLYFGQAAMFLSYFGLYVLNGVQGLDTMIVEILRGTRGLQGLISVTLLTSTWLVLGLASVVIGVGLRRGRSWAWTAAVSLEGAILILSLETYFNRRANTAFYLAMAVAIAVVLLLNQREAQVFYRANRATVEGQVSRREE
jgi:lysylphosphatidylglycerol synthetase-like protein (DUF2156 family)